jgi:mono/diheme cytochrome c family protein
MKNFLLGVLAALVVLAVGTFAYLKLGLAEVRADLPGSQLENYLMSTAVHASVRRHAPEVSNPIQPTNENLIAGGKMYVGECAGCHGTPGKTENETGDSLYPPIPQFPRFSGLQNTASVGPGCSQTASGILTTSCGRLQPSSSV